jgi:hypothetical protein
MIPLVNIPIEQKEYVFIGIKDKISYQGFFEL